jgi:predicted RNA binding protein YcfA (HicA-like mRNA interferase family)
MKIPRDVSYKELINALEKFGYKVSRQSGSHIRLTAKIGEKHTTLQYLHTIPLKSALLIQ